VVLILCYQRKPLKIIFNKKN